MPDFQIRRRTPAERLRYAADLLDATEGATSSHDLAITAASLILTVTAAELEAGQHKQPEAILARCCVCGTTDHGGRAFYENVRGQLFCWPCADGDRPKAACTRCNSRGYIPDFSNGLDPTYGEPGKKPCPDCQPPKPEPESMTPSGHPRCLSQYRSHVDGYVQCQLAHMHTTRHDYQNGVVACSWADGEQA